MEDRKWESDFNKVLNKILARKDVDVFRQPVEWEALGIPDYPLIIKNPMDLGTITQRMRDRHYANAAEAAADMRLVWTNAMLYNAPGSKIYQLAKSVSDFWEHQWGMTHKEDPERPPSTDEAASWVDMCHRLSSEEMGKVLILIDSICPRCLTKRNDVNEVEVNVDIISGRAFKEAMDLVMHFLPDNLTTRKKVKRSAGGTGEPIEEVPAPLSGKKAQKLK